MRLFDTHAHLADDDFAKDLDLVLERAADAGVDKILIPASDLKSSVKGVNLAMQKSGYKAVTLYAAAGVHPHDADSYNAECRLRIAELAAEPVCRAIGEIGLDYHYDFSPREKQKEVFEDQLKLAYQLEKPVIIHDRDAHGDTLEILRRAAKRSFLRDMPGVVHCFSGEKELAEELVKLGFYLGFDGPITFKNSRKAAEVIASVPQEMILTETDSPYLSPEPYRGRRNEPSRVAVIFEKIKDILNADEEKLASILYKNAERVFRICNA